MKDGSKIIDDFRTIFINNKNITLFKIKDESAGKKKLKGGDFIKTKIPKDKISKIIDNDVEIKKIKDINKNDVIANMHTNNKKEKYVLKRTVIENVIFSNGQRDFLEVLQEGYCNLYLQKTEGASLDLNKSGKTHYHYYVKRKGEKKITKLKGSGFILGSGVKSNYFEDCSLAMDFIAKVKKMNRGNLISLVKLYNENCIN
ncbi:hypothetical protein GCM10022395_33630 [Snuella lapsa]|uniref:Uncharacterized protein n=1 Tax=Snuella lapsa TaxID=870481 RepID=A0ABP6YIH0_9FLAO